MDIQENPFGSISWTVVTMMKLKQPTNIVEVTQVVIQC